MNRLAIILALCAGPALARAEPVTVTPILTTQSTAAGQPIMLPGGPVQVTVSRFEIAPGARLPVHRHPYPRYAYVVRGTLRVTNEATGVATTYQAGDVIIEMIGVWHSAANTGGVPVELIVTDQTPPGQLNTELRDR